MQKLLLFFLVGLLCSVKMGNTEAVVYSELSESGNVSFQDTIKYMEARSGSSFLHSRSPDFYINIKFGDLDPFIIGQTKFMGTRCEVILSNNVNPESPHYDMPEDLPLVIMHEIGHCFGLEHSPDPTAVMFWSQSPNERDEKSLDQFFIDLSEARSGL